MSHRAKHHETATAHTAPLLPSAEKMPAEHRAALLPEKQFQWRGGEITRLEAFCDVIFGFAMTLLVVSLEVPRSYAELMQAMRGFVPFAACFAQLVMIWRTHYKFSRRYGLEDPYTSFLNVVLLFLVLFYVYPLKFVFTQLYAEVTGNSVENISPHQVSMLMLIYGLGFAAVFLLFVLMYAHAYRLRKPLCLNAVETLLTQQSIQQNVILAAIGLLSCLVALKYPAGAGWVYFLIGPLLAAQGAITGRKARLIAESGKS